MRPLCLCGTVLSLAGLLAACGTGPVTPAASGLGQLFRGTTAEPTTLNQELIRRPVACPDVDILTGAEFVRRTEGEDASDRAALNWQASITKTARECTAEGEGVRVRVGVSGRVIEGPRGAPDTVALPVRVAVREGTEVQYSRLANVSVDITEGSAGWAYVDEEVFVTNPDDVLIVVGFDN